MIHKKRLLEIEDIHAPELDVYARLNETQLRHYYEPHGGLFIAESPLVIGRALDAGYEPVSVLVDRRELMPGSAPIPADAASLPGPQSQGEDESAPAAVHSAEDASGAASAAPPSSLTPAGEILARCGDVPIYTAPLKVLEQIVGFKLTRGLLCAMRRKVLPDAAQLCRRATRIAVLENVVNPTNIGAIFRSAAALGMDAVLLTSGCSDPLYRRAARVSMGTVFQIPWTRLPEGDWLHFLHEEGFSLAAMALTEDAIRIDDPRLAGEDRLALVLGTEGEGLMADTIAGCDYVVKIPMAGGVDSLNVAAASAVAFWTVLRRP